MGKISDALKKVMEDREQRGTRTVEDSGVMTRPENEDLTASDKVYIEPLRRSKDSHYHDKKLDIEDKLRQKQRFFLVSGKDDTGIDSRVVTHFDEFAPISEQYRVLRTNVKSALKRVKSRQKLSVSRSAAQAKVFTITSALQGEGKTVTSVNLAVSLSRELDSKILIVDCDLRKGSVDRLLNTYYKPGLSEVLQGKSDLEDAIHVTKVPNLFVLPAGDIPVNPSELLCSRKMRMVIERLKREPFSYVLLDTPPLLPFTDAGVLGAQTEGVLLVVQAHRTQAHLVNKAKESLEQAHANLIGFTLTQADQAMSSLYNDYYYYRSAQAKAN